MSAPAPTRLHISGLTPAISEKDIQAKLSSFGTVRALDGFDAKDGNGDPRKFGYAVLDAAPAQVTRCVTALSGTTWKGARLRIAPARPDFSQRWVKEKEENDQEVLEPPKKKRKRVRGAHGHEAADMEPVTLDNYENHHGWYKTPLGHLIHPMRMRPLHPVPKPAPLVPAAASSVKPKKEKKMKNKVKPLLVRARRKKLDPSRYGATHLTGPLLENALVAPAPARPPPALDQDPAPRDDDPAPTPAKKEKKRKKEVIVASPSPDATSDAMDEHASAADPLGQTLQEETSRSRKLLDSMFGAGEDDWRELDSDLEELARAQKQVATSRGNADGDDFETVPVDAMDADSSSSEESSSSESEAEEEHNAPEPAQSRSLKEMFAPREEEAGFSLMANLDLDLELDDELGLSLQAPAPVPAPAPAAVPAPAVALPPARMDEWRIDADAPGIRPLMFSVPAASAAHAFWRTETDEQIRARWEERKGALTADYKKRAKEAKKRGRRGGAGGGADGE